MATKPENDESSLQCTMPGCHERWSVNIGRPLCSFHQWGKHPVRIEPRELTQDEIANIQDKKYWAKKIVQEEKLGIKRPVAVIDMAKRALKIYVQSQ